LAALIEEIKALTNDLNSRPTESLIIQSSPSKITLQERDTLSIF